MRHIFKMFLLITVFVWTVGIAVAQQSDPHQIYEQNCGGCHAAHAGDFAFESTVATENGLVGKQSARLLSDLLEAGHGKLTAEESGILIRHLENILKSGRVYRDKCINCHDSAVELARGQLIVRDGVLVGRYSDRDIAKFLSGHGRLTEAEVTTIVEVFERQLITP
ncbi:MAG: hypothetical protein ABJN26_14675 [Stappiaceae bacterium]